MSSLKTPVTLESRRWRLWQVEPSLACNLRCVMCPWPGFRQEARREALMSQEVWNTLVPHLRDVKTLDFTGGGEPLLQRNLLTWIKQAKEEGCEVGFLSNGLLLNEQIAEELIGWQVDWLAFSVDGATRESYEDIRRGSSFETVTKNISFLSKSRTDNKPFLMINFVIMNINIHQIEDIIKLAHELGVEQVNFKQCDVIRGEDGKRFGLFGPNETKEIRQLKKSLGRARKLADKIGIKTTAFAFTPEELPVCGQDPRTSLFIRHDGFVSPCINQAYGGKTTFLGKEVEMPTVHFGRLPEDDLADIWRSESCKFYRERYSQRVKTSDSVFAQSDYGHSLYKLEEAIKNAREAMPKPPTGCDICHYLYDI